MEHPFLMFLDHTQRRSTVGRTPLDEWSAWHRDLYLKTHNTYNRQTSMPPVGFEPTISAGGRPQTYALDCVATGTVRSKTDYQSIIKCWLKLGETILTKYRGQKNLFTLLKFFPSCISVDYFLHRAQLNTSQCQVYVHSRAKMSVGVA